MMNPADTPKSSFPGYGTPSAPRKLGPLDVLDPDMASDRPRATSFTDYAAIVAHQWKALLDGDPTEEEVQRFLELHPSMIPGGSGDIGPGGHHGSQFSAVFRQPELKGSGPSFAPDFMWVTSSTSLITPVLIEIEKPSKRWFKPNGRPTADFRDAHDQLNDWRSWFDRDGNQGLFRERFLFDGDYSRYPIKPQFVLIYGRRSEFEVGGGHSQPDLLRAKRDSQLTANEYFMTFDSLRAHHDHSNSLTVTMTARGPQLFAFSPVYGTGTHALSAARILQCPEDALERSVMMAPDRKVYLANRWRYWRDVAIDIQAGSRANGPMGMGFE